MSERMQTLAEFDHTAGLRAAFLAGKEQRSPPIRLELLQAWERSRAAGVHPDRRTVPVLLAGADLTEYRESHEVYRSGLAALEAASDLLVGTGCGLLLADAHGTVLHIGGDPAINGAAESVDCRPGATWREDLVGNNAIGTALVTLAPVEFHFSEHWCSGWTDWVCAATAVLDPSTHAALAAVALVGHRQIPGARLLAMTMQLAGTLERQVQSQRQRGTEQLRIEAMKLSRWFPERGVLAVGQNGLGVWSTGLSGRFFQEVSGALRSLPSARLRGEQEILLADRYPCLVIPIWIAGERLGHVLIIGGSASRQPGTAKPDQEREPEPLHCIVAGSNDRRLLFTPDQILALRTSGGQIEVITATGLWPTPYESIVEVQKRLPPSAFFQTDRGCLVNLAHIKEIHPMFNRTVTLVLADRKGTRIPVSRRRTAALRRLLEF